MGRCPWGASLAFRGVGGESRGYFFCPTFSTLESFQMKAHLNAYLWFIGFTLATKILVVPMAKTMNIPYVKDL